MADLTLHTRLEPRGPAGALVLTDEQVAQLAAGKRPPVVVTIGDRSARLRLGVMGGENPEELLLDELGLEPDYIFDIM